MTLSEAKAAAKCRVPVQICGVTAKRLYGKIRYRRIARVSVNYDKYGRLFYTADLVDNENSTLVCGIEDVEIADDAPQTLRAAVERMTEGT